MARPRPGWNGIRSMSRRRSFPAEGPRSNTPSQSRGPRPGSKPRPRPTGGGPGATSPARRGTRPWRNRDCSRRAAGPRPTSTIGSRKCWPMPAWARAAAVSSSSSRAASPSTARSSASSAPGSIPPVLGSPSTASRSSSSRWSITPSTSPRATCRPTPTRRAARASSTCFPRFPSASTRSAGWTRRAPVC